ncbi:MAG: HAMP domain-containing sensor histidine kinase [Patescibacteria group bacterium]
MKILKSELRVPENRKIMEILELAELGKKAKVVFHDLSNHLTALTLSVGHMEENLARDTERLREYSKRSEKTRVQMEYVSALLRSHIENANETMFSPGNEIRKIIEAFAERMGVEKVKIAFESEEDIEIFGSKSGFIHIITNLISNSLDSFKSVLNESVMDAKAREIKITLQKNRMDIRLSVSDTGCGIKNADIGKIYDERFTTKPNGCGIGLSATKECVEQGFGGTISVKSSSDGTVFLIKIPKALTLGKQKQETLGVSCFC